MNKIDYPVKNGICFKDLIVAPGSRLYELLTDRTLKVTCMTDPKTKKQITLAEHHYNELEQEFRKHFPTGKILG